MRVHFSFFTSFQFYNFNFTTTFTVCPLLPIYLFNIVFSREKYSLLQLTEMGVGGEVCEMSRYS